LIVSDLLTDRKFDPEFSEYVRPLGLTMIVSPFELAEIVAATVSFAELGVVPGFESLPST